MITVLYHRLKLKTSSVAPLKSRMNFRISQQSVIPKIAMGMGRDAIHFAPSKRKNDYDGPGTSSAKRQHKPSKTTPHTSNKHSINLLKSQIRTLTRSLDHNDDLPAGVRIEKERALAGYRQDLEDAEHEKRRQAIISRYHMVRFFGE